MYIAIYQCSYFEYVQYMISQSIHVRIKKNKPIIMVQKTVQVSPMAIWYDSHRHDNTLTNIVQRTATLKTNIQKI